MKKLKILFSGAHTRTLILIGLLAVTLAIPITLRLVGQQQDLRQQASYDTVEECYSACDQYIQDDVENADCKRACRDKIGGDDQCEGGKEGDIGCKCAGSLECFSGKCSGGVCVAANTNTDPCAVAIDEKPNGCSCVPNSAYCASGYCNPDTRKCESPSNSGQECSPGQITKKSDSFCASCGSDGKWDKVSGVSPTECHCHFNPNDTQSCGADSTDSSDNNSTTDTTDNNTSSSDNTYNTSNPRVGGDNSGSRTQNCSTLSTSNPDGCTCQSRLQCASRACTNGICGQAANTSTSTCFGRVSYFVKDTAGNKIYDSGITIDVSGSNGNFKAQPIPFYNNDTSRLAIENLPEGQYSVNMNLSGYHLIELDGTNHASFFSESSLRVDCPPDLDPIRQDILIMYADLIVSDTEPGPEENLTCGTRCSDDTACVGSTDGCSTCTGTETEKRFGRGRCTGEGGTDPSPTPKLTCGSSCSDDSACAGSADGCTTCDTSRRTRDGSLGTCVSAPTTTSSPSPSATASPTRVPSSTPTATPAVSCGTSCTTDASCTGARDGCSKCVPTSPGSDRKTCQREGITPTQPPQAGDTRVTINTKMPGIGTNTGDNSSPNNPNRTATIEVYDVNNSKVEDGSGTVTYDGSGTYSGEINLGQNIPEGFYYIKVGFDNTLLSQIPGIQELKKDTTNNTPVVTLVPGDLNTDNLLEIEDYNIFYGCIKAEACSDEHKGLSDFNDDGTIGPVDYNILLRSYAIRPGD